MAFSLLYFGPLADLAGQQKEVVEITTTMAASNEGLTISELYKYVGSRHGDSAAILLDSCAVAVNMEYLEEDTETGSSNAIVIRPGDEVAIIPPVSSG